MRSRPTAETLLWSAASCHCFGSGGPAGSAGDGARRVVQSEFGGAVVTKPDDDVGSIRPEEGTYSAGDLYRIVNAQSLQRLKVKRAVVKFPFNTFVSVNTLPLTEHLSRHMNTRVSTALRGPQSLI